MYAIFWSRWNIWTLVDATEVPNTGILRMTDAMKANQMNLLGDRMVATIPPLSLRFAADSSKPRSLRDDGYVEFTIGSADICVNGQPIDDPLEKKLAWFFMLYGDWTKIERPAGICDGKLEYFEISAHPTEPAEGYPFSSLGFLSEMITRQYIDMTSEGRHVKHLTPDRDPEKLGVLIPEDYKGNILKLWIFNMKSKPSE